MSNDKAKHTPGPWAVYYGATECRVHRVSDERNTKANAISNDFPRTDEGIANARLIAAAPELLAALEKCREVLTTLAVGAGRVDGGPKRVMHSQAVSLGHEVSAAIAKARGSV